MVDSRTVALKSSESYCTLKVETGGVTEVTENPDGSKTVR